MELRLEPGVLEFQLCKLLSHTISKESKYSLTVGCPVWRLAGKQKPQLNKYLEMFFGLQLHQTFNLFFIAWDDLKNLVSKEY